MYSPTFTHKYTSIPKCTCSCSTRNLPITPSTKYDVDKLHGILISLMLNIISGTKLGINVPVYTLER